MPMPLYLQGLPLSFVHTGASTGINVTSTASNIVQEYYAPKELAARKVANGALVLEQFAGPLPPVILS